jgi:hypothetical protein
MLNDKRPEGWQGNDGQGNPIILPNRGDSTGGTPTEATGTVALPEKTLMIAGKPCEHEFTL